MNIKTRLFELRYRAGIHKSYSQAGEDLILQRIFLDLRNGHFVDVGAYHPLKLSNSYLLYKRGWRGINIDARPGSKKIFDEIRPEDINIETGIAQEEGEGKYYQNPKNSSSNTFSEQFLRNTGKSTSEFQTVTVKFLPLKSIVHNYWPENWSFDLLNVDVEGMDLDVLKSNDWERNSPKVVTVEIGGEKLIDIETNPIAEFLLNLGYHICAINYLFVDISTVFFTRK